LPGWHGVIGSAAYERSAGGLVLKNLDGAAFTRDGLGVGNPEVVGLAASGVQIFVVSGKQKVAELMCPEHRRIDLGPGVRVTYTKKHDGTSLELHIMKWASPMRGFEREAARLPVPNDATEFRADANMLELARALLDHERDVGSNAFLFLGLGSPDAIGHRFGHASAEYQRNMNAVDAALSRFLEPHAHDPQTRIVVFGDHGCREITSVLWPVEGGRELRHWRDGREEPRLSLPCEHLEFHVQGGVETPAVIYDGGTMRCWTRRGGTDAVKARLTAGPWARVIDRVLENADLASGVEGGNESAHPHFGDLIAFAKPPVALCKPEWIMSRGSLPRMPRGEHGTDSSEDREVPLWGYLDAENTSLLFEDVRAFFLE